MNYYISRNYKSLFNASGKAKTDCEIVLERYGFKNLGFKQSSIPNTAFGAIKNFFGITIALLKLPFKATLCTQYPNKKFRNYILIVAKLKRCKVITIIHDVRSLRGRTSKKNAELSIINTEVIIAHNPAMKNWFETQNTSSSIVSLNLFDYIADQRPTQNDNHFKGSTFEIAYAGGFGGTKNSYIYEIDSLDHDNYTLNLYGGGFEEDKRKVNQQDSILNYQGLFPSDQIAYALKGDFGLVWDGITSNTCSGQYGEYLRYNNPHKTSLYLLCGLPIIVWSEAAIAPFILENNLGLSVSNLKDLDRILEKLSIEDYNAMKKNVLKAQEQVRTGGFLQKAIDKALDAIK